MNYRIVDVLPKWNTYTFKIFLPKEGAVMVEFQDGIARTDKEAIADHFRRNPLRYQVEPEEA